MSIVYKVSTASLTSDYLLNFFHLRLVRDLGSYCGFPNIDCGTHFLCGWNSSLKAALVFFHPPFVR